MINQIITNIKQDLSQILTPDQMEALSRSLNKHLPMLAGDKPVVENTKHDMLPLFIAAKRVEGCSEKSLRYYESTIRNMLETINKPECQISTEDLRGYLDTYQRRGTVSKVTLDNVRRILSSFFAWLEDEDYIVKSPVRRIHKVKTGKTVKETYSDEALELMRDHCDNTRDLAMIDLLTSTGIRVGELVKLNRSDLDFENRECIVFGKGNKQRKSSCWEFRHIQCMPLHMLISKPTDYIPSYIIRLRLFPLQTTYCYPHRTNDFLFHL